MSRRAAWVVVAAGAWTCFIWVTRIRNVLGDERSTSFKVVHSILAAVSVVFGIALLVIGTRALRDAGHGESDSVAERTTAG